MILLSGAAWAMLPELDRPTLCARSTLAVVGEIATVESRWTAGAGGIETHVWLAVDQVARGSATGLVEIVLPGGQIGRTVLKVEHAPTLKLSHRYLVLLEPFPAGGWRVVGGALGAIAVGAGGEDEPAALASLGSCGE